MINRFITICTTSGKRNGRSPETTIVVRRSPYVDTQIFIIPCSIYLLYIIRKTKCFRPAKRNVQKAKRNVFVLDTLPNHIKIALERLSCQILTLFLYLLISVYPITTSRVSISANFKPQSFAALNNSFSSTASMATSTSLSASSLKYFSVFCF